MLRVRFADAGDLRSSVTPAFVLAVRPVVELTRAPRHGAAGLRVELRGRVTPRRGRVYQVLQLERRRRFRKVGAKVLSTTREGNFRGFFVPSGPGTYRLYVAAKADRALARGASRLVVVRISRAARAVHSRRAEPL